MPAQTPPFVAHCIELLEALGPVRAGRMFGGWGLYQGDVFIALIAFDRLYLKVDSDTMPRFQAAGCEPFVYGGKGQPMTMSYWTVPPEALDSPALMLPWARLAVQAALAARAARAPKRKAGKPPVKPARPRAAPKRAAKPATRGR
jgi:DNA transformation protein and related proteins